MPSETEDEGEADSVSVDSADERDAGDDGENEGVGVGEDQSMTMRGTATSETDARFLRWEKRLEIPMLIASVLVIPALLVELTATNPAAATAAWAVNALIWILFLVEYVMLLGFASDWRAYVKTHKLDLAIVVLSPPLLVPEAMSALRALRSIRVLRLMRATRVAQAARGLRFLRLFASARRAMSGANRAMSRHGTHYVITAVLVVILVAGGAFYLLEPDNVPSIWDGLWWATTTVTTVGYRDVSPETLIGKALAVVLRIVGIGLMAVITATMASWFVQQDQQPESEQLAAEVAKVRGQLDRLEELIVQTQEAAASEHHH